MNWKSFQKECVKIRDEKKKKSSMSFRHFNENEETRGGPAGDANGSKGKNTSKNKEYDGVDLKRPPSLAESCSSRSEVPARAAFRECTRNC